MKKYLLLMLIILLPNVYSAWTTYQGDLRNSGISNDVGYLPVKLVNFSVNFGMDYQPLVADINMDGKNDIVIFSNMTLYILNAQLDIQSQKNVGILLGQPTLYDSDNDGKMEVIFNSYQNSGYYFFDYAFDGELAQSFNISLNRPANSSGIKCVKTNQSLCVFKDSYNYVQIVDMEPRIKNEYATVTKLEKLESVPAIGDIDNDGRQEAVFWFEGDDNSLYGFMAFDIENRSIETNFNHSGIVENIYTIPFPASFRLKGQPVLLDLNNDNRLEIAGSVYHDTYDDFCQSNSCGDWFTKLFVYSSNGTRLFSKCGNPGPNNAVYCEDFDSNVERWEGTNPFVLDADGKGPDEICFVSNVIRTSGAVDFLHMALKCYNYTGGDVLIVNLTRNTLVKSAIVADVDADFNPDIITPLEAYSQSGNSLYRFNLPSNPIPVQIDGFGGLDFIWSSKQKTIVFLDGNNYSADLSVSPDDIIFDKIDERNVNVTFTAENTGQLNAENLMISMYNPNRFSYRPFKATILRNANVTFSAVLDMADGESVLIAADPENAISESDEMNNFVKKQFLDLPKVFVSVEVEPFIATREFKDYIRNNLEGGEYTDYQFKADVTIHIGKNEPHSKFINPYSLKDGYGFGAGNIIYHDKTGLNPYSGLVFSYKLYGDLHIVIVGNEIEGEIAAAKEFIENQDYFLSSFTASKFIDDYDENAVKIYDYMHLPANNGNYKAENEQFRKIVSNALNDRMVSSDDFSVSTENAVPLRLRELKPELSPDYLEYLESNGMPAYPIVISRGVHSNLTTWETLATELANGGRDSWLIEITGGPGQDCDNCPNYNFDDLAGEYWPALVNKVLSSTGKEKIQYVGHSNGGRVAIDSLSNGHIDPSKVETFVGVAIPGAFEGSSAFGKYFGKYGGEIMQELENKSHVSMTEIGEILRRKCLRDFEINCGILTLGLKSDNKMSYNTDKQYYLWITDNTDSQLGNNLELNNFYLIQGWVNVEHPASLSHDFIVTGSDEEALFNNIISDNKQHYLLFGAHTGGFEPISVPDRPLSKKIIKDILNKKPLDKYETYQIS